MGSLLRDLIFGHLFNKDDIQKYLFYKSKKKSYLYFSSYKIMEKIFDINNFSCKILT